MKATTLTVIAILIFVGMIFPASVSAAENVIAKYRSDGYNSFEFYHTEGDVVTFDTYSFRIPDIYSEVAVGAGQTFPLADDYSYGAVVEGYLVSGSDGSFYLEPTLLVWGAEKNWGFNSNIFQYVPLNPEGSHATYFDNRLYIGSQPFKVGMCVSGMLNASTFTEDHGPFVEFAVGDLGQLRLTYKAGELEATLTTAF